MLASHVYTSTKSNVLKAADLFRLNIDHPHLPMLCFISVGDGPLLPRGSQLEEGSLEETQNWEVGGESSRDPEQGTTHRKGELAFTSSGRD